MRTNSDMTNYTSGEQEWIHAQSDKLMASWLVDYARAINTLNIQPIRKKLSPRVTYESQSVFEKMTGNEVLLKYWQDKFQTIHSTKHRVVAELGRLPGGQPCVRLFQGADEMDTNWLDTAIAALAVTVNHLGEAEHLLMITCVPSPSDTTGSAIFPGCPDRPTTRSRRFVRASPDFDEIELFVFYLDGECGLDKTMSESVAHARHEMAHIQITEVDYGKMDFSSPLEGVFMAFGFNGFPSIGAMYKGHPIYRHQGLIGGHELVTAIKKAAPLYVAD